MEETQNRVRKKMFLMTAVHKTERGKTNPINTKTMKITQVKDQKMLKSKINTQVINQRKNSTCFQERKKKKSSKEFT
jgi:hypothetical protein